MSDQIDKAQIEEMVGLLDGKIAENNDDIPEDLRTDDEPNEDVIEDVEDSADEGDEEEPEPEEDDSEGDEETEEDSEEGDEDEPDTDDSDDADPTPEEINERLRAELNELAKGFGTVPGIEEPKPAPTKTDDEPPKDKPAEVPVAPSFEVKDYLTEEESEKLLDSPEVINDALTRMGKDISTYLTTMEGRIQERINAVPQTVKETVREQQQAEKTVAEFYNSNEDLAPYKEFVTSKAAIIAQRKLAANESATWPEVFAEAGKEVRHVMGFKAPTAKGKKTVKKKKTGMRSAKTGRRTGHKSPKKTTKQQDHMADLL